MSVKNLQQKIHTCQLKTYSIDMSNFNANIFAEWLERNYQESSFKSYSEIGNRVGVSRTTVSALAKARPQSVSGKPSRPTRSLVVALANVFNADVDEVLQLAGHAPIGLNRKVSENEKELIELFEKLTLKQQDLTKEIMKQFSERNISPDRVAIPCMVLGGQPDNPAEKRELVGS
jgi:transcriptional regulator with XRE-family HTH domain